MSFVFVVVFRISTAMSCIWLQKYNDIGERVPTRNINVLLEYSRFNAVNEKKGVVTESLGGAYGVGWIPQKKLLKALSAPEGFHELCQEINLKKRSSKPTLHGLYI